MEAMRDGPRAALGSGHALKGAGLLAKVSAGALTLALASAAMAQQAPAAADEDIVVTGYRASLANAIAEKKSSDMIVESISAEDIGKLPDTSIAESISRLPGLAAQREGGRARNLSIRGLAPDFSTTLLNGREQVTTNDNRGVDFDQFPSEMISQVNVYKTPSANLIGAGLSGTVDLRTARPLDKDKRTIALGARAELLDASRLNPDSSKWGYRFSGTYIDQFADNRIGIALNATHMSSPSQTERFEAWGYPTVNGASVIGGTKSHAISGDLERTSLTGTLEWRPSEAISSSVDIFWSRFKDHQTRRGIELPLAWGNGVPLTNAVVEDGAIISGTFSNVKAVVRNDIKNRDADLFSAGWNVSAGNDVLRATFDVSYAQVDRKDLDIESYSGTGRGYLEGSTSRGATDT
ncbi:TonB-dependent receptor, partial [Sandaracinobacter neustonicus]